MESSVRIAKVAVSLLENGYKNQALSLLESYTKTASGGIPHLKQVISYLSMSDLDKKIDLIHSFDFYIREDTDTLHDTLESSSTPQKIKDEIKALPEEEPLYTLSEKAVKYIAKHLNAEQLL